LFGSRSQLLLIPKTTFKKTDMNTFGRQFRVSIFGESHSNSLGVVIDGCPAGITLNEGVMKPDLDRRRSGAKGTTPRNESDKPNILCGVFNNKTTGAPIAIVFENTNTRSKDYTLFRDIPRPGHTDFVASKKFGGFEDYRGGGHFSGRITTGLVAAGILAKKIIAPVSVNAKLIEAGGNTDIEAAIAKAIEERDSIGGIIECAVSNMPVGLGEPFFDSVESYISHMIFAIPATKGIEFGSGFNAARMKGSKHNDRYINKDGKTETNHAAGINGGISNGNDIVFRVPVKPTSSTQQKQKTLNFKDNKLVDFEVEGRHDTCIALCIPVIIEAATAIALADLALIEHITPRIFN
jgi:chorismate synthase